MLYKVSVSGFNLWRYFHSPFRHTMKTLKYLEPECLRWTHFRPKRYFFSFQNRKKSQGARSGQYWGWWAQRRIQYFRKSCTTDDALSCTNMPLAKPVSGSKSQNLFAFCLFCYTSIWQLYMFSKSLKHKLYKNQLPLLNTIQTREDIHPIIFIVLSYIKSFKLSTSYMCKFCYFYLTDSHSCKICSCNLLPQGRPVANVEKTCGSILLPNMSCHCIITALTRTYMSFLAIKYIKI
jgi:hypothetical protein